MYNTFLYNTTQWNDSNNLLTLEDQDNIVFNEYSLQNTDIISSFLVQDSTPSRDLQISDIPRNDGRYIIGDFWREKIVSVKGIVRKSTNALLEAELDKMKKALAVREAFLDIKINGVIRRYRATLVNGNSMFQNRQHYHITFCPFEVQFLCVEPFGHSVDYIAFTLEDKTELTLEEQIDNIGTIRAKPIVILNFTQAVGITEISFKNNTRNEEIKLTKNIVPGDYVRFDSELLEVTVNSIPQDYDGSFPLLDTDVNSVTISILGTSCQYTYTAKYLIPYL